MFKFSRHIAEQLPDGQVLGANAFAFAAGNAVGSLTVLLGIDILVVVIRVPVMIPPIDLLE